MKALFMLYIHILVMALLLGQAQLIFAAAMSASCLMLLFLYLKGTYGLFSQKRCRLLVAHGVLAASTAGVWLWNFTSYTVLSLTIIA
ncbi:JK_5P [Escherichia phage Jk06]|uniref:JK_5P n=1 Tax=Escherichia phage Jk06 TaxID=2886922 RepID=Q45Q10_9CAUD|nr:hypothetical protein JK_5 [Escherichia phage Jk06]AAZ29255.1 JK_5P [Escherichia phage Jk06]